ncbi:TAXI family TRAP transporter solute-binding subunit [Brevibacillus fulvus]|uniref:TRAP transporter TAXI family solute receptor n=1 Tax=Brevibacillus fulvus TaxID=1125967 RepID=A0A938XWC0_9BACL|nr:TAXI family TRAP transporter solute-binding subunit [Brevibacillus fulvus]MBM7589121.1 TRAP transporter TAXI family solute receptor [Brevibacillus fulvus]
MKALTNKLLLIVMALALTVFAGCGGGTETTGQGTSSSGQGQSANAPEFISIGTAASGSSIYLYGTGLAELLKDNLKYSQFDIEETGGSIANMNLVNNDELQLALTGGDVLNDALKGQGNFQDKKVEHVSIGWKIAPSVVHFVTLKDSGIRTIQDMKGKRVSIGASGSAANLTALTLLKDHGITESDVTLSYLGWNEAVEALGDGAIDVAMVFGTLPSPVIESLGVSKPVSIVSMDPEIIKKDKTRAVYTIPANTYKGQDQEVVTAATEVYIVFQQDLDEQVVYDITKLAMENTEKLGKVHPMGAVANVPAKEDVDFLQGTIHPGALKYFKEKGSY